MARQPTHDESLSDAGHTIRIVAARTGLSMDTLRVWERRFGFPRPVRRAGSNRRLYSKEDLERLLSICRALDSGYRIGDVINKSAAELASLAAPEPVVTPSVNVERLLDHVRSDRLSELEHDLRSASLSLGPRGFLTELAHPFAVAVGQEWAEGRLSVRHEHVATECLTTRLRAMLATYQDVEGRPTVLLTTLPGELHGLPLLMVGLFLAVLGAKVRLLGASTPADEVLAAARAFSVDVVGVAVTEAGVATSTRQALHVLARGLPSATALWVGGAGAPQVVKRGAKARIVCSWTDLERAVRDVSS